MSNENSSHTSCQTLYLGISSTQEATQKIGLTLFPNPTDGDTRVHLKGYLPREGILSFYNLQGQLVQQEKIVQGAKMIDLSGLESGTYIYEFRDGVEVLGSGKVVVL